MTATAKWDVEHLIIKHGQHQPPNGAVEACAMEAAYLRWAMRQGWPKKKIVAGWTDNLDCVDGYIGGFVRRWNDSLRSDEDRTRIFTPDLLDLLPGTAGGDALMLRRMWTGIDWDIRTRTVAFLRLAKLSSDADALAALPEIVSQSHLTDAREIVQGSAKRATAAWAAAGTAAWAAAGDALKPTVLALQESAKALLVRMCETK
jgi:hypothetical protein